MITRHRASTSMYSLTFRVRVTTPPQYGQNGTAHAAGASMLSLARGVFANIRSVWHCVRRAVGLHADYRWALPRISSVAIATQPVHRLQIRPVVHNQGASPTTPPSYIRVRVIVQACGRGQTYRQTNTETRVSTIHFASSTTHAKCNKNTISKFLGIIFVVNV